MCIQVWDEGGEINWRVIFLGQLKVMFHELWNMVISALSSRKQIYECTHVQVGASELNSNPGFASDLLWTLGMSLGCSVLPYL